MTRFGMKEADFEVFAQLFADAVKDKKGVADKVAQFRGSFLTMRYCFDGDTLEPFKNQLLDTF